jgi:circadian clock protein KaiB
MQEMQDQSGARRSDGRRWVLRLFVIGMTPSSARAVRAIKGLCEEHLRGRYELQVCDLYTRRGGEDWGQPDELFAAPQLLRLEPGPKLRIVGELDQTERVLQRLGIHAEDGA